MNSYAKFGRALLLIFLSFSFVSTVANAESNPIASKVILIDEAHGQFINSSLLTEAVDSLEGFGFHVLFSTTPFTQQLLTGVDLVIIPNPSQSVPFTTAEDTVLSQWMTNGKGLMLLSNPLDINNASLNGSGKVLNDILSSSNFLLSEIKFDMSSSATDGAIVNKYQNSTIAQSNLLLPVNGSIKLPDVNNTLIVETQSTTITALDNETILDSGYDSFSVTSDGSYLGQDKNLQLFGGLGFKGGRIVIGGSTLMFSDLKNPFEGNKTWFNSADNGLFFVSLVKWTLNISNASFVPTVNSDFYVSLALVTGVVGVVFVVLGLVSYVTGKEMKIFEIDQDFLRSQSADSEEDKTGLTKSQKRLQQRMKNK